MAAGKEKKRSLQGNYQQMVNTFLILLSYRVDLGTFVLLCEAPEIASHGTAEEHCSTERQGTTLTGAQEGLVVG